MNDTRPEGVWDPGQYLRYGSHRLRPAIELFQRVDLDAPARCWDIGCGNGEIARKEQRRKFIRELRDCGGPCQMRVHIFHPGGPHGSIRFAWRLPVGEVDRDDTAEAAAVATATAAAPLTASREMRRSFFERFSPARRSPAVLNQMYQHLTGDSAAPHDSNDKVG